MSNIFSYLIFFNVSKFEINHKIIFLVSIGVRFKTDEKTRNTVILDNNACLYILNNLRNSKVSYHPFFMNIL